VSILCFVDSSTLLITYSRVSFYCFGLGHTHKPDAMVELSSRTKASYLYVREWTSLRDCIAGVLGALSSTSHQLAKLQLSVPEGLRARFQKITGVLEVTKRANGREVEVALGDLRFGDRRGTD